MPTVKELDALYRKSWQSPSENCSETGNTSKLVAEQYFQLIEAAAGPITEKAILDFGAGRGSLVSILDKAGVNISAVEPYAGDELRAIKRPVYDSLDALPANTLFDGIILIEVVEHLDQPRETIEAISNRLAPGGWMLVTTPNARGLNARVKGNNWREAARSGHLCLFNEPSLTKLLLAAGLVDIRRLTIPMRFTNNPLRHATQRLMQALGVDGGLRMIARRKI